MTQHDPTEAVRNPARLAALRATGLLDTPPEESSDRLTRLAVRLLNVPVALIALVDESRDFYKSHCGFGEPLATTRQLEGTTFCHYAIAQQGPLVIPDTRADPVFRHVPTVESLGVAAYAAVPIRTADGHALGTFCAVDFEPHAWTDADIELLTELAKSAEREIQLREAARQSAAKAQESLALSERLQNQATELERQVREAQDLNTALGGSEERYRALAEADPDGIVAIDNDSTILSVNPAMGRIFGYEPEELVGQPLEMLIPERFREGHHRGVGRYLATGKRNIPWQGVQVPGRRRDGSEVPIEINFGEYTANGQHVFAGFMRDITERKRAEAALQFQTTLLEAQNHAAIDGILVAHNGKVLSMNRRYAELFNVPEELRPLDRCKEMFQWATEQAANPEEYRATIAKLRNSPDAILRDEVLLADGRVLDRYSAPLKSPDGEFYGRIWVVRDITERKRFEVALQAAKEEAERANRAKSEFLSRMSHELRTPMNSVLGFAQLLTRKALQPDERKGVDHILKAGRHLLKLIDEVLDLARIEANRQQLSVEPVHAGTLLDEALAMIRPTAQQHQVSVSEAVPTGADVYVRADRQRLMQVMLNLLSNAIKYNHEGGSVELLAVLESHPGVGSSVVIGVRDTGTGIPAERLGELFVPFSRLGADQSGIEGTGLGLALSQRLVEAMGGQIRVESTSGEGSTFWVVLPLDEHPMSRLGRDRLAPPAAADANTVLPVKSILYVEDNLANLDLVESIFAGRPEIRLLPALQGRMGLDLAREHHPDLILLDLHLPDLPGEMVLRQLSADPRTRDIPVVVISADATSRQIERLRSTGARAYLTKPLDVDQFLATVDAWLPETTPTPA